MWEGIEYERLIQLKTFDGEQIKGEMRRVKRAKVRLYKGGYKKAKASTIEEALHLLTFERLPPSTEEFVGLPEGEYEQVKRSNFDGDLEKVWEKLEERGTMYSLDYVEWWRRYVNSEGVNVEEDGRDMVWEAVVKGKVVWEFTGWNTYPSFDPTIVEEDPIDAGNGKKYLVLQEEALKEWWEIVSDLFKAPNVWKGISRIKIGNILGSFTLMDTHKEGAGTCMFDEEGNPKKDWVVVENGMVKGFYSNRYYSRKMNIPCTACARSLFSPGNVSFTNVKVEKGDGVDNGMAVRNMTVEYWEPTSGDFAAEVYGASLDDKPVKPFVMRGNVFDILKRMDIDKESNTFFNIISPKIGFEVYCLSKG